MLSWGLPLTRNVVDKAIIKRGWESPEIAGKALSIPGSAYFNISQEIFYPNLYN